MNDAQAASAAKYNRSGQLDAYLVEAIQAHVGAKVDGDPGPATARSVAAWQAARGLDADGKLGPVTLESMSAESPMIRLIRAGRGCSTELVARVYPDLAQVVDLSFHQDNPDSRRDNIAWATLVRTSGVKAIILKATEGAGYRDPQFENFRAECERWGVKWSAYHYAHLVWRTRKSDPYAITNPITQAEHFVATTGADRDGRRLWLDLERKTLKRIVGAFSALAALEWTQTFLQRVDELTGQRCGVYTSQGQVREYLSLPYAEQIVEDRPTWWAYYPRHPWPLERRTQPPKHPPGLDWDIWQYSGEGRCPGVQGDIDLNIVNGGQEAIERLFVV